MKSKPVVQFPVMDEMVYVAEEDLRSLQMLVLRRDPLWDRDIHLLDACVSYVAVNAPRATPVSGKCVACPSCGSQYVFGLPDERAGCAKCGWRGPVDGKV